MSEDGLEAGEVDGGGHDAIESAEEGWWRWSGGGGIVVGEDEDVAVFEFGAGGAGGFCCVEGTSRKDLIDLFQAGFTESKTNADCCGVSRKGLTSQRLSRG